MSRQYSVADAKNHLPALVHEVEQGESVEITRRGKAVAVILSIGEYRRLRGDGPDLWRAVQQFRATHDLDDLDIESVFRDVRDRSGPPMPMPLPA